MIEDILSAVKAECLALCQTMDPQVGTLILDTDFKDTGKMTYSMPFMMLDMMDGPDTNQWLGGASKVCWDFRICVYGYEPDAYADDSSGYSESLLAPMDLVRRQFSQRQWLTAGMGNIETQYGFRFTLDGIHKAPPLRHEDGLCLGWAIRLESIAVDLQTDPIVPSTQTLNELDQVGYPQE